MKVLLVHNYYRSEQPSGENLTVGTIATALAQQGATVEIVGPHSDDLASMPLRTKARIAARPLNASGPEELADAARSFKPDVIQLHNVYPQVGIRLLRELRRGSTKMTHVVHNYRHTCVAGVHYRNGHPCFDCTAGRQVQHPAILHACYRGSRAQSAVMVGSNYLHHEWWRSLDGYVAISGAIQDYLIGAGFPSQRIEVIHNPVEAAGEQPGRVVGKDLLYTGRLTEEKGILTLLEAVRSLHAAGVPAVLHIAGSGPLETTVAAAAKLDGRIVLHGRLTAADVARLRAATAVNVIPSLWAEPFGRVVAESFASGRPVVVTDQGALPSLVVAGSTGWISPPTATGLADAIRAALSSDLIKAGEAARAYWEGHFSPSGVAARYMTLFERILAS